MTITVYANLAEDAKKKLDKIAKKAAKYSVPFSYAMGEEHPQKVVVREFDYATHDYYIADEFMVSAVDFEIECDQLVKSNGWTTRAMIEHGETGNIVTTFGNYEAPLAWYNASPRCDHCGTNRVRNVTFMVEHESGAMKQVGKSCLKDYTGISPVTALMFAEITGIDCNGRDFELDGDRASGIKMWEVVDIIALACDEVKKNGYRKSDIPNSTRDIVTGNIKSRKFPSAESLKKAEEIMNWITELSKKDAERQAEINKLSDLAFAKYNPGEPWELVVINEEAHTEYLEKSREAAQAWDAPSGLERDCFPLVKSGYAKLKHFGRLCYLPVAYEKYLERKAKVEAREKARETAAMLSDYLGKIGERITVKVKEANVVTSWETMYGTTWLNKIVDSNGNILIWKSSSYAEIKSGDILKGTVKEHSEYDGVKQTVVARCKIN